MEGGEGSKFRRFMLEECFSEKLNAGRVNMILYSGADAPICLRHECARNQEAPLFVAHDAHLFSFATWQLPTFNLHFSFGISTLFVPTEMR